MRELFPSLLLIFATVAAWSSVGAERDTLFLEQSPSTLPEIQQQWDSKRIKILNAIETADSLGVDSGFGFADHGLRLGLIVLNLEAPSPARIYSAIVMRNDSPEPISSRGRSFDVIEILAWASNGQAVRRTSRGNLFNGPPPDGRPRQRVGNLLLEQHIIPLGGQIVYEINLAELFDIPLDQPVTFSAVARPRDSNWKIVAEARSKSVTVSPNGDNGIKNMFDKPEIPAWVMARVKAYQQTNKSAFASNAAIRLADARYRRTNSLGYKDSMINLRSNGLR